MGFIKELILKLNKYKKNDNINNIDNTKIEEKVEKVEKRGYEYHKYDLDYFNQCEKRLEEYDKYSSKTYDIQIDKVDNIIQDNKSNSMYPYDISNNLNEDSIENKIERYYEDDYSKEEKIVDITNQQFSFNRTDSNLNVNGYDPDRRSEEFMYDLNNDARIGINTDAERFNESLITDRDEFY